MKNSEDKNSVEALLWKHGDMVATKWSDQTISALYGKLRPKEATIVSLMTRWFPKIAAAAIIVFTISTIQIYIAEGSINSDAMVGIEDITPDEAYEYLAETISSNE